MLYRAGAVLVALAVVWIVSGVSVEKVAATSSYTPNEALNRILDELLTTPADTTVARDTTSLALPKPSGCDILDTLVVPDTTARDSSFITTDTASVDTVAFTETMPTCCHELDTLVVVTDSFWVCTDTAYVDTISFGSPPRRAPVPTCYDVLDTLIEYTIDLDSFHVCTDTVITPEYVGVVPSVLRAIESGGSGKVAYDFAALDADSTTWVSPPEKCGMFGWDLIRFTAADGPCSLFLCSTLNATDTVCVDTLVVPFPGMNMGAQGSFVPLPVLLPLELEGFGVATAESLSYLRIFWLPKRGGS